MSAARLMFFIVGDVYYMSELLRVRILFNGFPNCELHIDHFLNRRVTSGAAAQSADEEMRRRSSSVSQSYRDRWNQMWPFMGLKLKSESDASLFLR